MDVSTGGRVGEASYEEMVQKAWHGSKATKIAKVILRLALLSDAMVVAGSLGEEDLGMCFAEDGPGADTTSWWATLLVAICSGFAIIAVLLCYYLLKKFNKIAGDFTALQNQVNTMNEQWGQRFAMA